MVHFIECDDKGKRLNFSGFVLWKTVALIFLSKRYKSIGLICNTAYLLLQPTGVGYKKNQSDNWIAHQDDFNAILADLNDGNPEQQTSVSSIESTSKKSRSRVQ